MWVAVLVVAAAAVAAYEWLKPAEPGSSAGTVAPSTPNMRRLSEVKAPTSAAVMNAASAVAVSSVPQARSWVQSIAHTGFDISAAGDSLVQAILLIARVFGDRAIPANVRMVANYGLTTGQDWSLGSGAYGGGIHQTTGPARAGS